VPNAKRRPREYLTVKEVGKVIESARGRGRYEHRDATMILIAYRHGLRVSELCALRWDQIDFQRGLVHVRRLKNGTPSVHPMGGTEIRALRRLLREQPESRHVFATERRAPMSSAGFRKMLGRIGEKAKLPFPVHPHMLRHACGYKLANDGQDTRAVQHYLGHKNIQHTVRYTELSPERFKSFWED
jgi:type 1 fimbriae regulatory protein FimB/type 1 fimbriae regulatory protein FimE